MTYQCIGVILVGLQSPQSTVHKPGTILTDTESLLSITLFHEWCPRRKLVNKFEYLSYMKQALLCSVYFRYIKSINVYVCGAICLAVLCHHITSWQVALLHVSNSLEEVFLFFVAMFMCFDCSFLRYSLLLTLSGSVRSFICRF